MGGYLPLRGGIFVYDLFRLIVMIEIAVLFPLPVEGTEGTFFPLLAYMASNALFPLMAFLFWLRPGEYKSYIFLYIAGKIIGITANIGWLVFSYGNIILAINGDSGSRLILGQALALGFLDGLSVLGGFLLHHNQNRNRINAAQIEGGL
jgi:hypothetical protein